MTSTGSVMGELEARVAALREAADWIESEPGWIESEPGKHTSKGIADWLRARAAHESRLAADLSPSLCMSRGPRIGNVGVPHCKRERGHEGRHAPAPEEGWGGAVAW